MTSLYKHDQGKDSVPVGDTGGAGNTARDKGHTQLPGLPRRSFCRHSRVFPYFTALKLAFHFQTVFFQQFNGLLQPGHVRDCAHYFFFLALKSPVEVVRQRAGEGPMGVCGAVGFRCGREIGWRGMWEWPQVVITLMNTVTSRHMLASLSDLHLGWSHWTSTEATPPPPTPCYLT